MRKLLSHLPIDTFIALLLATVAVAALLPAHGVGAPLAGAAATLAIALLFFLYGIGFHHRRRWRVRGTGGCIFWCSSALLRCSRRWGWPRGRCSRIC